MASNFKIVTAQTKGCIRLSLYGDFDATSAHELLNFLNKNRHHRSKIYIRTHGLNQTHLFGMNIFKKSLGVKNNFNNRLIFSGDKASEFNALIS
jgi:hypothetical protein